MKVSNLIQGDKNMARKNKEVKFVKWSDGSVSMISREISGDDRLSDYTNMQTFTQDEVADLNYEATK